MAKILRMISRKRPLETSTNEGKVGGAELDKCLTTVDLISLGVGSCCGAGMYLTAGIIAAKKAGPAGVFSLCLAGIASVLTGFHYAELAGICPHTSGSAYMYTYVTVGELSAFVIGWGLIVEYVIGTSAAAVALSETLHSLTNNEISDIINGGLDKAGLPHVDIFAAVICLLLMWLLASGVQMSARVNNVLNTLNFVTWVIFLCAAFSLGSASNWTAKGGFLPFGYAGVFSAIPTAYYAFVGFDGLATTGAECKNPVRSIPIAIIGSIVINIVIFANVILGLTFNIPYSFLPPDTAMLDMFAMIGYPALKYVLAVGAVAGLFAATFGSLFPLPRVLQAMAQDGLFFRYFAHVCPRRHTALRATILSGLVATFLAAFVKLGLLIEMVLIGTLLAYVIVTFVTLVLRLVDIEHVTVTKTNSAEIDELNNGLTDLSSMKRKSSDTDLKYQNGKPTPTNSTTRKSSAPDIYDHGGSINNGYEDNERQLYTRKNSTSSLHRSRSYDKSSETVTVTTNKCNENSYLFSKTTSTVTTIEASLSSNENTSSKGCSFAELIKCLKRHVILFLLIFYGWLSVMCAILANFADRIRDLDIAAVGCLAVSMISVACMAIVLMFLPHIKRSGDGFRTPLVPFLTVATAGINIYLMTSLTWVTWLLFLAWLFVGLCIYAVYGTRNSSLNVQRAETAADLDKVETELPGSISEVKRENSPLLHCE